ncbi:MAG: hypothetical protein AAGB34_01330, partial [Planctomycetota bacterium]
MTTDNAQDQKNVRGEELRHALKGVRTRARIALVSTALFSAIAGTVVWLIGSGLLDYAFRLPRAFRGVLFLVALAVFGWYVWRRLIPAIRFAPSLTELALRLERDRPGLATLLASAIDFSATPQRSERTDLVVERAQRALEESRPSRRVSVRSLAKRTGAMLTMVASAATLFVASPELARTGFARTAAPWLEVEWPRRFAVESMTDAQIHPAGQALPVRALLTKSTRAFRETDVYVRYRFDDRPERRELLTAQGYQGESGTPFERLIDTSVGEKISFRFEAGDDSTAWQSVRLIDPPRVVQTTAEVLPPDYAQDLADERLLNLGPGTDARAIAPSSLVGSEVRLTVKLSKQATIVDPEGLPLPMEFVPTSDIEGHLVSTFVLEEEIRLSIVALDEHGIVSVEPAVYRFPALTDEPASVAILTPSSDRLVLPTAAIPLVAEARDDVALRSLEMRYQRYIAEGVDDPESTAAPSRLIESGESTSLGLLIAPANETTLSFEETIDLLPLELDPGDEVHLKAFAFDLKDEEPTESSVRRLRVISEESFTELIRNQLTRIRETAMELEQSQQRLIERSRFGATSRDDQREQATITRRAERLQEELELINQQIAENRLNDPAMRTIAEQSEASAQRASESSRDASEVMAEAASRETPLLDPAEQAQLEEQQATTQTELTRLANLLDRGEDAWAVRSAIQRLLRDQKALQQDTAKATEGTEGQSVDELSDEQRQQLRELANRQDELAQRANELQQEMAARRAALEDTDQAAAQGVQTAQQRARQEQLEERMERASELTEQNRGSGAQEQQQQAAETLEQMLEDLEASERARDEALRRQLASLLQSIEQLIVAQRAEIDRLDNTPGDGGLPKLAGEMIALNTNTISVQADATDAGPEAATVAATLDRATAAQSRAIGALRSRDREGATNQESRSLELLIQALREAQQADQRAEERQRERQLAELRQAYREVLKLQVLIVEDTIVLSPPMNEQLDRRERIALRRIAERQQAVREQLALVLDGTEELAEARIFAFVHEQLDRWSSMASEAMLGGDASGSLNAAQRVESSLRDLLESLEDPENDQPFRQHASGGGGGGGGQGGQAQEQPLIAPLAELRLLRAVQISLAERTRLAEETQEPVESVATDQRALVEIGEAIIEK